MPVVETYTADFAPAYPVPILYEDNHLLFTLKPPGLLAQADYSGKADILNILKAYLVDKYDKPGQAWLGLVHRLDQPVGGVMVFAKTSKAASRLSDLIRRQKFEKTYYAIVRGQVEPELADWQDYISKETRKGRYVLDPSGRPCRLTCQRLASREVPGAGRLSLLKIQLHTGRPHQIRVQCASRSWPLLADRRYGLNDSFDQTFAWPALFATGLAFQHPVRQERIEVWADCPQTSPWTYFSDLLFTEVQ